MRHVPLSRGFLVLVLAAIWAIAPVASAQVATPSLPGVTVLGSGHASAPAESATIVLMLGPAYYYDPKMQQEAPPVEATTPVSTEEAIAPVIAALVAAGVPEADIQLLANPYSGEYSPEGTLRSATLAFDLDDPSADRITAILDAAVPVAVEQGYFVNMVGARYGVTDCSILERQAREAAITDARDKATMQAELLGVTLGDVTASQDDLYSGMMYSGGVAPSSCTQLDAPITNSTMWNVQQFDPAIEPQVVVSASIYLTFGISSEATPAS